MTEAPTSISSQEKTESLNIEQDNNKYLLLITNTGESLTFIVSKQDEVGGIIYIRKMTLKEIKEETDNLFLGLNSCQEFSDYIKALSETKNLSIIKKEDKLSLNFRVEYLLKKHFVEIDLFQEKKELDFIIRELCQEVSLLKESYKEIPFLKERIKILENKKN